MRKQVVKVALALLIIAAACVAIAAAAPILPRPERIQIQTYTGKCEVKTSEDLTSLAVVADQLSSDAMALRMDGDRVVAVTVRSSNLPLIVNGNKLTTERQIKQTLNVPDVTASTSRDTVYVWYVAGGELALRVCCIDGRVASYTISVN